MDEIKMTQAGLVKAHAELKELLSVARPANEKRLEEAIAHGDLSENAEYTAAKDEQGRIAGRILDLQRILNTATVIEPHARRKKVELGARVVILNLASDCGDTGVEEFTLVGTFESDPANGKISDLSPVGSALIGKRPNDIICIRVPDGVRKIKVVKIA